MKKWIALLITLTMLLGLMACGAKSEPAPAPETAPEGETQAPETDTPAAPPAQEQEDVTLSLWIYDDGEAVTALYEEWIEDVHETYPWITIDMEILPYDSGPEKFVVACATNTTPDLYFDGYSRIAPAVKAGLTVDISDLMEKHSADFLSPQKDGMLPDGNYGYVATATGAAYCVIVNMDIVERLGLTDMLPEDLLTWSYEDLLAMCRAAKEADPNVIPIDLFAGTQSSDAYTYSWFLANGVELTNDELTATAFNQGENREKAMEVLNLYKTLIDEGLTVEGPATQADTDTQTLFEAGNVMLFHGAFSNVPGYYGRMEDGMCVPFTVDGLGIPTAKGEEVPTVCNWGSYGYCGFKNNGNEEAIRTVLDHWLSNPYYQSQLSNITGRLSLMSTTTAEYATEAIATTMERAGAYGAAHAVSNFGILESWWADFRGTFFPNLQEFYVGKVDAGTMLDNWQKAADQVIAAAHEG